MRKKKVTINIYGMHCKSCESLIADELDNVDGVLKFRINRKKEMVTLTYDEDTVDEKTIKRAIKTAGYDTDHNYLRDGIIFTLMLAFVAVSNKYSTILNGNSLSNASYIILFLGGIISSFHCVGMCGGLILSNVLSKENILNDKKTILATSLKYNTARTISYTIMGGLAGLVGSAFSISTNTQGFIQIAVSIFMMITGLKMFGFKLFRNLSFNFNLFSNLKIKALLDYPVM